MGWALEDHTADVLLRVEAASWPELLREAAVCFGAFVGGGQAELGGRKARIDLRGSDPADAWVRYWRALHRLWVVEGLLPVQARVDAALEPPHARAELRCVPADELDLGLCEDVKAVTWHGAEAVPTSAGWCGRLVLDV